jgi:flagellar basal body-associated protein FliL
MKKLILVILILLLLAGGGIGVMTVMGKGPFAEFLAEQQKKKEEEEAKKAAEAPPPPTVFFDLGTYIIPVVQHKAIVKQVGFDMEIEVEASVQAKVAAEMPRLQNAVNLDLYDIVPNHMDIRNPDDKAAIRAHLIALATKEFGEGKVHDVVIKSMYYR